MVEEEQSGEAPTGAVPVVEAPDPTPAPVPVKEETVTEKPEPTPEPEPETETETETELEPKPVSEPTPEVVTNAVSPTASINKVVEDLEHEKDISIAGSDEMIDEEDEDSDISVMSEYETETGAVVKLGDSTSQPELPEDVKAAVEAEQAAAEVAAMLAVTELDKKEKAEEVEEGKAETTNTPAVEEEEEKPRTSVTFAASVPDEDNKEEDEEEKRKQEQAAKEKAERDKRKHDMFAPFFPILPEEPPKPSKLPRGASPLPDRTELRECGETLARLNWTSRMFSKKWQEVFWIRYGDTSVYFYRSKAEFEDWLTNWELTKRQRNSLLLRKLEFYDKKAFEKGIRGYKLSLLKGKKYNSEDMVLYHYKLMKQTDVGDKNIAAFAAGHMRGIIALRTAINDCLVKCPLHANRPLHDLMRQYSMNNQGY